MTEKNMKIIPFPELQAEVGENSSERFAVRSRGRPQTDPAEAKAKKDRRKAFGAKLKAMRDDKDLTLAAAAEAAGIASARKLSQYETTCYPPGWVISQLAPVYGVEVKYLAALALSSSDPDMFSAIADNMSPEEFSDYYEE